MPLITWTKEPFGTNVSQHDEEHKTIFRMLNDLDETVAGGDRESVGRQLDALIAFVAEHFANEQRNMEKTEYADYEAHRAAHDDLVKTCVALQEKFHAGEAEVTTETTNFIASWLTDHIPNIDRPYGPVFNAAGIS